MNTVHVRKFEVNDAEQVSTLIRKTMRISNGNDYHIEKLEPLIEYFSPEKVIQLSTERTCLVAEVGKEKVIHLVGTIAIEVNELLTFFVDPEFQGRGLGRQLFAEIEEVARANGLSSITCESSLTAVPFYLKQGFAQTGFEKDGTAGKQNGMIKLLQVS